MTINYKLLSILIAFAIIIGFVIQKYFKDKEEQRKINKAFEEALKNKRKD